MNHNHRCPGTPTPPQKTQGGPCMTKLILLLLMMVVGGGAVLAYSTVEYQSAYDGYANYDGFGIFLLGTDKNLTIGQNAVSETFRGFFDFNLSSPVFPIS